MATKITIVLAVLVAASIIMNFYLYQKTTSLQKTISQLQMTNTELNNKLANARNNQTSATITGTIPPPSNPNPLRNNENNHIVNSTSQSITAVAVKAVQVSDGFFETVQYQGTVMDITVDIRDGGKGLVLVNTEVPTGVDFQTSARTAVKVAQSITGADLTSKDIIFSIKSKGNSTSADLQAVDGPSAGGAMTALLTMELQGRVGTGLRQDVVMTGTINSDSTIGPVGGVPQKALAAGQYGAKIFLVPVGQAVYAEQSCQKRQEGPIIYQTCQSEQKPLSVYTEKNYGMKVIEVNDVKEALAYFESR